MEKRVTKMASKKTVETETTTNETVTLEQLQASRKALNVQIKALKQTRKANGLAEVIARQENTPNKALVLTIQAAVRQRVRHGAELDDAVAGVLAVCEQIARAALDKPEPSAEGEPEEPEA